MAINEEKVNAPPYLPLKTFLGSLDALREAIPKRIDRGIWRSQSGATQGQIIIALRFFELVNDSDAPSPLLETLAKADGSERKKLLKQLVKKYYEPVIAHDLTKMTSAGLNEEMGNLGLSGDTRRKAVTFFLQIAKHLDLPLSPFLLQRTRRSPSARRKKPNRASPKPKAPDSSAPPPEPPTGPTKTVTLGNGITLTMTTSADPFKMASVDRRFVMEMLDKLEEYETKKPPSHKPSGAGKKGGAK